MKIVTISREFGSGGRELGKRLAEQLHFPYYDREIITAMAQKSHFDEKYIENVLENGNPFPYPIVFRRTFSRLVSPPNPNMQLLILQQQIIKELGMRTDCVIVGRGANVILKDQRPLNLFVYADMPSKIKRCQERAPQDEHLTEQELKKKIKQVDLNRKKYYELLSQDAWGDKLAYHLCINTSGQEIRELVPTLINYVQYWFERNLP